MDPYSHGKSFIVPFRVERKIILSSGIVDRNMLFVIDGLEKVLSASELVGHATAETVSYSGGASCPRKSPLRLQTFDVTGPLPHSWPSSA